MNYNESSDEDDFRSPSRPPVSRSGSPVELAIPQLNDNVDEELEQVKQVLQNVGNTPLFRTGGGKEKEEDLDEVIDEGLVVGAPDNHKVEQDNPAIMPEVR